MLESLAAAGAFDTIEQNRARAFSAADQIMAEAQLQHESAQIGALQFSFGETASTPALRLPSVEPWLPSERLQKEYEAVGFFLTGHPLDDYLPALKRMRIASWSEFSKAVKAGASAGRVAATVTSRLERRTKTGTKMGIIGLSDPTGQFEAVLFSEGLQQYRDALEPGKIVLLGLSAEVQGEDVRARIQTVESLEQAAAHVQKELRIHLSSEKPLESVCKRLEPRGDGEIIFVLRLQDGSEAEVKLPGRFKVSPQIAGAIKAVSGVVMVEAA